MRWQDKFVQRKCENQVAYKLVFWKLTRQNRFPLTIGIILILSLIAIFFIQIGWRHASILCLGGLIIPLSLEFNHIVARAEPLMSARTMANFIQEKFPGKPVLMFQDFESFGALPIYLGHTIQIVDSTSADLFAGQKKYPDHPSFLTSDEVLANNSRILIVVMRDKGNVFMNSKIHSALEKVVEIGPAILYVN